MKLKDLDPKIDIRNVKLKLTEDLKKAYDEYCGPHDTDEIYIVGDTMGDFFISVNYPPTAEPMSWASGVSTPRNRGSSS